MRHLLAVATLLAAAGAQASDDCGAMLQAPHAMRAQGQGYTVAFVPQPAPLASGRHFALDVAVCAAPGAALPKSLRVDADMPAHRHGMNYRATVAARDAGRYRAEGLMLHMPGRWRFIFDLALDGRVARLTHEVDVP
ncbi:MAG TPA: FixH family protein [Burkholderiaceae bacterium]|nr:FixH family protein [Burkholderiaceae bacterium]